MNKTVVLVVEDDRPIRNLIVTTLKMHDYKYLTANNGVSAIMEASSHHPDIVLLDLGLPDMEGVDVIKKIRTWSNMPIIIISARSEDSDKIEALDSGADDYITKPFSVEELILVRMDVQLIIQVLVNLIDNAIKYTPKGSKICIRGMKCNGKAQICVEDNGPGIADEMKPYIFEMFYTGKSTIADSQRSLGLGLSLCQSIIEAHDGRLLLTDNTPRGCIFTFTLPLSEVTLNE